MTRFLKYTWAAPTTLVGLLAGAFTLVFGRPRPASPGGARIPRRLLHAGWPNDGSFSAMTLGHVIIGRDALCLEFCRKHEQAHVRQVERWGPAFIPAYLLASLLAWRRGEHYYRDNWFERNAQRACGDPD